jgi:hypothetical protein
MPPRIAGRRALSLVPKSVNLGPVVGAQIQLGSSSIIESASIGAVIGALSVTNGMGTWTFSKQDDPDGKFVVAGANLGTAAALDFETKTSHSVTIQATNGLEIIYRTFSIGVVNVIEGTLAPATVALASGISDGALIFSVSGLDLGANEKVATFSPNDGRVWLTSNGKDFVKGLSAIAPGSIINLSWTTTEGRSFTTAITAPSAAGVQNFVALPETQAYAARFQTAPTYTTLSHLNRVFKKIVGSTAWAKITQMIPLEEKDALGWKVNAKSPGVLDPIIVGSPARPAGGGVSFPTNADYIDTGIALNTFNQDSFTMMAKVMGPASASTASDIGALDGANGISMLLGAVSARAFSAVTTAFGSSNAYATPGYRSITRVGAAGIRVKNNAVPFADKAATKVASTSSATIWIGRVNGSTTASARTIGGVFIICRGEGLTDEEEKLVYGAWETYFRTMREGAPLMYEAGVGPAIVTHDLMAYSTTPGALEYALTAARLGVNVGVFAGWRDHPGNLAGMSGNGLGGTDWYDPGNLGGMHRDLIDRAKSFATATVNSDLMFVPNDMIHAFREKLAQYNVPIYYTNGALSTSKTGTKVNSVTCADGRVINAKYWHDGSYEGDLLALAGITCNIGREAAGGIDGGTTPGGWRGFVPTGGRNFKNNVGAALSISPYVIKDDPNSGLLFNVDPMPTGKVVGAADPGVQAFNLRLTTTDTTANRNAFRVPIRVMGQPPGFSASNYESLARWHEAAAASGSGIPADGMTLSNALAGGAYIDLNNNGAVSTNLLGSGSDYCYAPTFAARELVVKKIQNWVLGQLWFMATSGDTRLSADCVTFFQSMGLANDHYIDPYPGDPMWLPGYVYVREHRRMQGMMVHGAGDLLQPDGSTPRSINTLACSSYTIDHHNVRTYADTSVSPARLQHEGNVNVSVGSKARPIPYEVTVPQASECTNMSCSFAVSATSLAHGSLRMEPSHGLMGQASGVAATLALRNGERTLQSLTTDYATLLRPALLAEVGTGKDSKVMYLPQTIAA